MTSSVHYYYYYYYCCCCCCYHLAISLVVYVARCCSCRNDGNSRNAWHLGSRTTAYHVGTRRRCVLLVVRTAEQRLYGVSKAPDAGVCGGDVELVSLRGCDVDYDQRQPLKPHHQHQHQQQQQQLTGSDRHLYYNSHERLQVKGCV